MQIKTAKIAILAGSLLILESCCTNEQCLDKSSTVDKDRVGAVRIKLNTVYYDNVNAEKGDRTDWKFVMINNTGKLTVQLHWDNINAKMELDVFDIMGIRIQEGRPWGANGRRTALAIEEPGPYYIRVRGAGDDDYSQYSIRAAFVPDTPEELGLCQDCHEGERKCLGPSSFITCEKTAAGCTAWSKAIACPKNINCNNGLCGTVETCTLKAQRCHGSTKYQICVPQQGTNVPVWGEPQSCPTGLKCKDDHCIRLKSKPPAITVKPAVPTPPPVTPKPPAVNQVRGKIISIYHYRGNMTLHIEIGDNPQVKPGLVGTVLDGNTSKPLPGGEIRISKVTGRYAIATTTLQQLGKNRWVRIDIK